MPPSAQDAVPLVEVVLTPDITGANMSNSNAHTKTNATTFFIVGHLRGGES